MKELFGSEKNRGVTLIELIVVIAIMAALTGVLYPAFSKYIDKSRKSKDIYTADEIARAVNIAFIENSEAYEKFQKWDSSKGKKMRVSATVNGVTRNYDIIIVASNGVQDTNKVSNCFNGNGEGLFKRYKDGRDGFYGTINRELGLSTTQMNNSIVPQYKVNGKSIKNPDKYADRWRICKRADNGMLEIWVSQPDPWGGYPIYRVWPDPDDVYTK